MRDNDFPPPKPSAPEICADHFPTGVPLAYVTIPGHSIRYVVIRTIAELPSVGDVTGVNRMAETITRDNDAPRVLANAIRDTGQAFDLDELLAKIDQALGAGKPEAPPTFGAGEG